MGQHRLDSLPPSYTGQVWQISTGPVLVYSFVDQKELRLSPRSLLLVIG